MKIPSIPTGESSNKTTPPQDENAEVAQVLDELIAQNNKELGPNTVLEVWASESDEDNDYDGYDYEETISY